MQTKTKSFFELGGEKENMKPYYQDDAVTLWHGKTEEVLPVINIDMSETICVTDPPYGCSATT